MAKACPLSSAPLFRQRELGQFFTPASIVSKMLSLRRNRGAVLEPSAGDGAFLSRLEPTAVAIEIDGELASDPRVQIGDFFAYPTSNKFDTIIGNPPYVRFQDIGPATKRRLPAGMFDRRSNLYLFFISKCIEHLRSGGELIFITPRDFLKATSARRLNRLLYETGSMTHYYELGDAAVFADAAPNCAIWRWQKGRRSRKMATGGTFQHARGQLFFGSPAETRLEDFLDVKVGAVSGADSIFINRKRGCTDMVCSQTVADGQTRRVIYNRLDRALLPHKPALLARKIRSFNESNWFEWGRKYCERTGPRLYVNAKTRRRQPFYVSEVAAYDGSVLALFPKPGIDVERAALQLNAIDWEQLGFVCDGRLLFTQRSLANAPVGIA